MGTEEDSSPLRVAPSSQTQISFDPSAQQRWTEPEVVHLIDSYQEKWYQLKRGPLKARHWEEVANNVFLRCGGTKPSKSSVQCRHKVEKLRKKYREEKHLEERRGPGVSLWMYFERMDAMERGLAKSSKLARGGGGSNGFLRLNSRDRDAQDRESTMSLNEDVHDTSPPPVFHHNNDRLPKGAYADAGHHASDNPPASLKRKFHVMHGKEDGPLNLDGRKIPSIAGRPSFKRRNVLTGTPIAELASVVRSLGEGFLRIEQLKLEMRRDNERLRAEMEFKRTGMVLDSQKQIAEMFSKALGRKKGHKKRHIQEI